MALINADGLFKDNKKHIFICAITNLVLSIILVNILGIDGVLLGTVLAFLLNILLKTNLISKKILKDVKQINILKYFIISIILFITLSIVVLPLESYFLSISTGFIGTVLKLGLTFIAVITLTSLVLYITSKDARNLFERGLKLIKRKLGK